jgi:hypothetical protein
MFSLMLNLRFKSFLIIFSFVERKQGVVIVQEYDRKSLNPMMLKCHEHFHPLIEFQRSVVNYNIFIMIIICIFFKRLQV